MRSPVANRVRPQGQPGSIPGLSALEPCRASSPASHRTERRLDGPTCALPLSLDRDPLRVLRDCESGLERVRELVDARRASDLVLRGLHGCRCRSILKTEPRWTHRSASGCWKTTPCRKDSVLGRISPSYDNRRPTPRSAARRPEAGRRRTDRRCGCGAQRHQVPLASGDALRTWQSRSWSRFSERRPGTAFGPASRPNAR